jgi:hypothetical protein
MIQKKREKKYSMMIKTQSTEPLSSSLSSLSIPQCYYDPKHSGWCYQIWGGLHSIADSFPLNPSFEKKEYARNLFYSISQLLPCEKCQIHMTLYLQKNPLNLNSGPEFSKWMYDFHNDVRFRTGEKILTDQEAQEAQEWIRSIKWSIVEKDLKTDCSRLCSHSPDRDNNRIMAGSNFGKNENTSAKDEEVVQKCANIDKQKDFRIMDNFNLNNFLSLEKQSEYSESRDNKRSFIIMILFLFIMVIIIFTLIMTLIFRSKSKFKDGEYLCVENEKNLRCQSFPNSTLT